MYMISSLYQDILKVKSQLFMFTCSLIFFIFPSTLEYRYPPPPAQQQDYQQMLLEQQQAVTQRMQQFYDANSGIRYNIVIPSNLSASQKVLYEEQLRRGIVDRLGSNLPPGPVGSVYQPRQATHRPRHIINVEPGLQRISFPPIGQQQPHQQGGGANAISGMPSSIRIITGANNSRVIPVSRNLEIQRYKYLQQQQQQQQQPDNRNLPNGDQH